MDSLRFAFGLCAAVLQCAPRARTKGRVVLRIRQSASKDGAVTGPGRERFTRIATPFSAEGEAISREGHARSTLLSQATGCDRLVAEALAFHKPLPCRWQGKGEWLSLTFHPPRLWPARLWKRLAVCLTNALPWVRARGAHCKTVCTRSVSNLLTLPLARCRWCGVAFGRCHWSAIGGSACNPCPTNNKGRRTSCAAPCGLPSTHEGAVTSP